MIEIGRRKTGVVYEMTKNEAVTDKKVVVQSLNVNGIVESRTSMSFPNLLMILPWGVVSK